MHGADAPTTLASFNNFTAPWNQFGNITLIVGNATDLFIPYNLTARLRGNNQTLADLAAANNNTLGARITLLDSRQVADNTTLSARIDALSGSEPPAASSLSGGIIVYASPSAAAGVPQYRVWNDTFFDIQKSTGIATGPVKSLKVVTSPRSGNAIMGSLDGTGDIILAVYNKTGDVWGNPINVSRGPDSGSQAFDIAYETNTGRALVVYRKRRHCAERLCLPPLGWRVMDE